MQSSYLDPPPPPPSLVRQAIPASERKEWPRERKRENTKRSVLPPPKKKYSCIYCVFCLGSLRLSQPGTHKSGHRGLKPARFYTDKDIVANSKNGISAHLGKFRLWRKTCDITLVTRCTIGWTFSYYYFYIQYIITVYALHASMLKAFDFFRVKSFPNNSVNTLTLKLIFLSYPFELSGRNFYYLAAVRQQV